MESTQAKYSVPGIFVKYFVEFKSLNIYSILYVIQRNLSINYICFPLGGLVCGFQRTNTHTEKLASRGLGLL